MSLQTARQEMSDSLGTLRDAVTALGITVHEDIPEAHALGDRWSDAVDDLLAALEEGLAAVRSEGASTGRNREPDARWQALSDWHDRLGRVESGLCRLRSYEWLAPLLALGRRRNGEWQGWTRSVKQALDGCLPLLDRLQRAWPGYWHELAVHSAQISASVTFIDADR